jgi:hypothetical protein
MKDVMLDLETLGNGKHAAIVQIGVCYFDRLTGEIGKTFKMNVDAISVVKSGGELDAQTVYWWLSQDKAAINSIIAEPRVAISEALTQLNEFLQEAAQIWSHATFDFVILTETYKRLGIQPSYRYQSARDIRTLVDLGKVTIKKAKRDGVHHDALDDCFFQVKYCVEAFKKLEGK